MADEHLVASHRGRPEEVVEGRERFQVAGGDPHHRRRLTDALRGAPSVLALDGPERGKRGGADLRVAGHRRLDRLPQLVGNVDLVQARERRPSAVDASQDRVEHRQVLDQVGDVAAHAHVAKRLEVDERGVADVDSGGLRRAIRDHEAAQLSARPLDRVVGLARRHPEALGDQLEVVDQGLHRGGELVARRQHHLAIVGDPRALGEPVERLLDDPHRLAHLLHPDAVAVVAVAHGADRDLKVEVRVGEDGIDLAQVPWLAGGAQQRPGDPQVQQSLARDDADVLGPSQEDLVAVQDRLVLVDPRGHLGAEGAGLALEADGDVLEDASDLEVAGVHPLPGRQLEQVEDPVAVPEAVEEHRHRAEVERPGAEPDEVRVDPVQLQVDHSQVLGARRDLQLEQALDAADERLHVEEVGEVVHPLHERDHLPVGLVLAVLLDPGVDVAHHRLQVADHLPLEADQQPQHPVGGGMVRPHVDRHQLLLGLERLAGRGALHRGAADHLGLGARDDVSAQVAHSNQRGTWRSLWVKITGSPPTGKSRRCGQPT